jgi:VanZ family protein
MISSFCAFVRTLSKPATSPRIARLLLFGYLGFLVYGSLYPISSFRLPEQNPLALIFGSPTISRTDALANLLLYVPLGWLLGERGFSWARAGLLGSVLSFVIECLQAYLPGRVPSFLDWGLNSAGTVLGAVLATHFHPTRWPELEWIRRVEPRARLGLAAVGTWVASQLFPFIPSIDIGSLRHGLRPVWHVLRGPSSFSFTQAAVYALAAIALSRILLDSLPPSSRYRPFVPAAFLAVLAAKVPIIGRQLSLEALTGAFAGLAISRRLAKSGGTLPLLTAAGAFVVDELRNDGRTAVRLHPFNWIPLRNTLENELIGAADILATAWPFLAMAYVVSGWRRAAPRRTAFVGAAAIFVSVMALEWAQSYLPGRSPDVTDALVATGAWLLAWRFVNDSGYASGPRPDPEGRFRSAAGSIPPRPEPG